MRPEFTSNYLGDKDCADAEALRKVRGRVGADVPFAPPFSAALAALVGGSYQQYYFFGEFCLSVALALSLLIINYLVGYVFSLGEIFQIEQSIIPLIPIIVVYLVLGWSGAEKGQRNKSMNARGFLNSIAVQGNGDVWPLPAAGLTENLTSPIWVSERSGVASYSAKIRDGIDSFISDHVAPFFGFKFFLTEFWDKVFCRHRLEVPFKFDLDRQGRVTTLPIRLIIPCRAY